MPIKIEVFDQEAVGLSDTSSVSFYVEEPLSEIVEVQMGAVGPRGEPGEGVDEHLLLDDPHPQYLKSLDQVFALPDGPLSIRAYTEERPVDIENQTFQALRLGLDRLDGDDNLLSATETEVSPLRVASKYQEGNYSYSGAIDYNSMALRAETPGISAQTTMGIQSINNYYSTGTTSSVWSISSSGLNSLSNINSNSVGQGKIISSRVDASNPAQAASVGLDGGTGVIHLSGPNGGVQISTPHKNVVFSDGDGTVNSTYVFANNSGSETIASREWVGSNATPIAHSNNTGYKHNSENIRYEGNPGFGIPEGTVRSTMEILMNGFGGLNGAVNGLLGTVAPHLDTSGAKHAAANISTAATTGTVIPAGTVQTLAQKVADNQGLFTTHTNSSGNKHAAANISTTAVYGALPIPAGTVQAAIQNLANAVGSATGGVKIARLYNGTLPSDFTGGIYFVSVSTPQPESEFPNGMVTPTGVLVSYMAPEYGGEYNNRLTFSTPDGAVYTGTRRYVVPTTPVWVEVDGEFVEQTPDPYWTTTVWTRSAPIVVSPDGTRYKVTVGDDGTLGTTLA